MDISQSLKKSGREDMALRSLIAKSVIEVYGKDITIHSVNLRGNTVIISTWNSLLNSELQLLSGKIKTVALSRLKKVGIILSEEIRFRFI